MATVLGQKVVKASGSFLRLKRWFSGWNRRITGGVYTIGLSGKETLVETDVIRARHVFFVSGPEATGRSAL